MTGAHKSSILIGRVMHSRRSPVEHTFEYPVYMYRVALEELDGFASGLGPLFGYNRYRPVSIWDRDYLFSGEGTIKDRLFALLRERGVDCASIASVELVTGARFFGYVFNPVNFYLCYDAEGATLGHVVEINNTFGERHAYVLFDRIEFGKSARFLYRGEKSFFVSPFNRIEGRYEYQFSHSEAEFDVRIDLLHEGGRPFISRLWGRCSPLTRRSLLRTILAFPIGAVMTMPRILWQAQVLRFKKRLPMLDPP